ncbi:MAG: pectin acetylesterase-family hydrolase [Chloroflexota bacterium]
MKPKYFSHFLLFTFLTALLIRPPNVQADDPPMTLQWLAEAVSNGTVCNDGSAAGYYLRPGTGEGAGRWVIYLQGGGFCIDEASCDEREATTPGLMTSTMWEASKPGYGILSPSMTKNPDYYNANHVFVPFCSSDGWSGDRPASLETDNRHFRGTRIFQAIIAALQDPAVTPSPNLAEATDVLLTGSSSGGNGVMVHLDWLAAELPQATVKGINDAGWAIDVKPYDPSLPLWSSTFKTGYNYWFGVVDATCASANAILPSQCYLGPVAYPYVTTPLFIQAAQRDAYVLGTLGIVPPIDPSEQVYALDYALSVRLTLESVTAGFSPAGTNHSILASSSFSSLLANGYRLCDVIGNWAFQRPGPIKVVEQ